LSQCSTVFAMRLSNESDQRIIGTAIGDTSASNLAFLPTMAQREAIAFGEAVATPMRLMFEKLAPSMLPAAASDPAASARGEIELTRILHRMRNSDMEVIDLDSIEGIESALDMADSSFSQRTVPLGKQAGDPFSRLPTEETLMRAPGDSILRRDRPNMGALGADQNPFAKLRRD
jgi:uncharacterized protein